MKKSKKNKLSSKMNFEIFKKVRVSDSDLWYQNDEVLVKMWHCDFWEASMVRIAFFSTDDKMMYRDFTGSSLESVWESCRKEYFDAIPDKVSTDWMIELGFERF